MRISRVQMLMEIAHVAAKRSTCHRKNVGAVVAKGGHVVSIGYNGAPSGAEHCLGSSCPLNDQGGCQKSVHAEINAMYFANLSNKTNSLSGMDIYSTAMPCPGCCKSIFNKYMRRVFYQESYRDDSGIKFLLENNIEVYRTTPGGFIISERTGHLIHPEDLR